jgi:septal ring-binding cell division protein DamX
LSGDHYVIELAHGEREADIAAARAALHVPHGEVYELHLRQNGADAWLLVWGSFEDVGAARAARGELPADVHAGWPRRVAPLQAEVRRVQE